MTDGDGYDLIDALDWIDPHDYGVWDTVGMALKHEGYDVGVWVEWSRRDPAKFHDGECERKWRSFGNNAGAPVTGGTIVHMARANGWQPTGGRRGGALEWDSVIGGREAKAARAKAEKAAATAADEPALIDPSTIGDDEEDVRPLYGPGHECEELRDFIDALFDAEEIVGWNVKAAEKKNPDGTVKLQPAGLGTYSIPASQVKEMLKSGRLENAVGALDDKAGAWWRVNPLDGEGIKNKNVTDCRYTLLESDEMPQGKFAAIVKRLNIPVAAWVDSGRKSLHAIVRIDAGDDRALYDSRVATLYARCRKNGIEVDGNNKNPSRLCRMPGAMRDGRRQFLAGLASGAGSWDEWDEWYINETDELPDAAPLSIDLDGERPEVAPELIHGVLRKGDKMLLAGPSKAGKSFALMELCAAFADGGEWFGHKCEKSRVLYVNLELTEKTCNARFYDVFRATGARNVGQVVPWNLKGYGQALAKLKRSMVRRCRKNAAEVIIIDPIYKVMMGDESSAKDMSEFTNALDEIVKESGCSLIYCHHHSKGYQGEKKSIDRASGSGVFGRDADAIVDMIEVEPDEKAKRARVNALKCADARQTVCNAGRGAEWAALGSDVESIGEVALEKASGLLDGQTWAGLAARFERYEKRMRTLTAWRVSYTLREFERMEPDSMWFDHPVHVIDPALKAAREAGAEPQKPGGGGGGKAKKTTAERKNEAIAEAVQSCAEDCVPPTRANVLERLRGNGFSKPSKATFDDWTKNKTDTGWCEWKCQERDGEHVLVNVSKGGG